MKYKKYIYIYTILFITAASDRGVNVDWDFSSLLLDEICIEYKTLLNVFSTLTQVFIYLKEHMSL